MTDGPVEPRPHNDNNAAQAGIRLADDMLMGLRFYSRLPTGTRRHERPDLSRIALALPFTSLAIGIGPALLLIALELLGTPHYFAAALSVGILIVVCGAMSEDALADAADGLFGGRSIEERLEIMKDSRHGTYGVCTIATLLLLRVMAIGSVASPLAAAGIWLTASILARSGSLWLTAALPAARSGGASASSGQVTPMAFGVGGVFALILSFVCAGFAVGIVGLIGAYAALALVLWGWITLCRRMIGGQTGDLIGALQALLEIAVLSAFMVLM